jgi:hypothetical protein
MHGNRFLKGTLEDFYGSHIVEQTKTCQSEEEIIE